MHFGGGTRHHLSLHDFCITEYPTVCYSLHAKYIFPVIILTGQFIEGKILYDPLRRMNIHCEK